MLGLGAAGGVSAGIATTTGTTSTGTTTAPQMIADGVRIGGVEVGGLTEEDAVATVEGAFAQPLPLLLLRPPGSRARPARRDRADPARRHARPRRRPRTEVKLRVKLSRLTSEAYVASVAKRFDRKPVDARLWLRRLRPWVSKQKPGWSLRRLQALCRTSSRRWLRTPASRSGCTTQPPAAVTPRTSGR